MKAQQNWWQKLFTKRIKPAELIDELKRQERTANSDLRNLDYDSKKSQRERETIIARGVKSADKGDSAGKTEAATELRALNAEIGQLQNHRRKLVIARTVARFAHRKLERFGSDVSNDIIGTIMKVMEHPQVQEMVANAEIKEEEFENQLNRMFDSELGSLEQKLNLQQHECLEEEKLLEQLAEATRKGDTKKAAEINRILTGDAKAPTPELEPSLT